MKTARLKSAAVNVCVIAALGAWMPATAGVEIEIIEPGGGL